MPLSHTRLRMTRQRRLILEELRGVTSHPSAEEVHAMVRRRLPHVSLSTVYRNLEILTSEGIVQKLATGTGQARFDGNAAPHAHLACVECGVVRDLDGFVSVDFGNTLDHAGGFQMIDYQVVVRGVCPTCRAGGPRVHADSEGETSGFETAMALRDSTDASARTA